MQKSLYTRELQVFCDLLWEVRREAGLTQAQVAQRVEQPQSWVSRVETGQIRLDFVQLRAYLSALGLTVQQFADRFEAVLADSRQSPDR